MSLSATGKGTAFPCPYRYLSQLRCCTILNYLFSNGQDARSTKLNFIVEQASCLFLTMVQDARSTKLNFIVEQASCLFLTMVQDVRLNLFFRRRNQTSFIQTGINLPEQFKIVFG